MTLLFLLTVGVVCGAWVQMRRVAFATVESDAMDDWQHEVARALSVLGHWMWLGPLCWAAAFTVIELAPGHAGWSHVAAVLGLVPLHGVLLTVGWGCLTVVGELEDEPAWARVSLVVMSAAAFGASLGLSLRAILSLAA